MSPFPRGGNGRPKRCVPTPRLLLFGLCLALLALACRNDPEPTAIHLVDRFPEATVENTVPVSDDPPDLAWSFEDESAGEWRALHGIEDLTVRDGRLTGRTGETPILVVPGPENPGPHDVFHALEIEMRVSAGTRLELSFESDEELDEQEFLEWAQESSFGDFNIDLEPGDELRTYTLTAAHAIYSSSYPLATIRHLLIRPTDAVGAEFEIASVRFVSLQEYLASIPSGVGWQGLGDIFRETLVARAPERITFELDLPSDPFLDLALGTIDDQPVTFRVEAEVGGVSQELVRRTISTPQRWNPLPLDLSELAGRRVTLTLALESEQEGSPGYWGSPVVRSRTGRPHMAEASPARESVVGERKDPPQGVILVIADTLRRDHLPPYGYEVDNAPVLSQLAREGAVFKDAISQGTWTKVSVSSIVTSLYPTTHGVRDMPDRLPAAVTTLAEAHRSAGYATFATSSIPFTGKLTNLHQGFEVLHESTSIPELDHSDSKTSRTYVDRLLEWIEAHHEVPFFALLHVFDPHSPFEPYRPYETLFLEPEELEEHRRQLEELGEIIDDDFRKSQDLPNREELAEAGFDESTFLTRERAWYDASIRAMDVEIGRLRERLEQLGLAEDTLIAFVSDHGEEFLEHGRRFHGYHAYGEMLNVPLMLWWPGGVPSGLELEPTVQSIDLMPTLLELSRLPVPERAQGQSLLPLLAAADAASLGWKPRPAFAERAYAPAAFEDDELKLDSRAMIHEGWKLIHNVSRPEGWPEYELYDHVRDPLNLEDVAADHPERVKRMSRVLDGWHKAASEARVEAEEAEDLSPEEIEKLRSLGYLQ